MKSPMMREGGRERDPNAELYSCAEEAIRYMERDRFSADRAVTQVFMERKMTSYPRKTQDRLRKEILEEINRRLSGPAAAK